MRIILGIIFALFVVPAAADERPRGGPDINNIRISDIDVTRVRVNDYDMNVTNTLVEGVDVDLSTPVTVDAETSVAVAGDSLDIGDQTVSISRERQVPNLWLNQSANIVNCTRVIGFGAANSGGTFSFGIPAGRQRDCDVWLAVNEAQENGHIALSYAFMCEIRNIRKVWGQDRCESMTMAALTELAEVGLVFEDTPMMAQVAEEEFEAYRESQEEQRMLVEDRIAQQENLIHELEEDHASKDAEIERLMREAAALRAAQAELESSEQRKAVAFADILQRIESSEEAEAE